MNGNMKQVVEDAKSLAEAVFEVYPVVAETYKQKVRSIMDVNQEKILFDLAVACVGIANKEQRVQQYREDRKNGCCGNGQKAAAPPVSAEKVEGPVTKPTPPQPPAKPAEKKPEPNNGNGWKPRDTRNRPVEQLIQELNIKSPAQAGFLRARHQLSYREWRGVHEFLCQREIEGAGALPP